MKTDTTAQFIPSLLNIFASNVDRVQEWQGDKRYIEGVVIRHQGREYLAGTTGFTGTTGPVHSSGKAQDGGVIWYFLRDVSGAESLGGNLYLGVGEGVPWKAEPVADDIGAVDHLEQGRCLENTLALIRLSASEVTLGVPRNAWASSVIPEWPAEQSFVVVGRSVYRCLSNNAGAVSTVNPSGTALTPFELADGYVWKFLGAIPITKFDKFATAAAFPVFPLTVDDGSERWLVQSTAKNGSISGFTQIQQTGTMTIPTASIIGTGTGAVARADLTVGNTVRRIVATTPGQNYSFNDPAIAVIHESGAAVTDEAAATAIIAGGGIDDITVTDQGSGYAAARAFIVGDGSGATLSVVVTSGFITDINVVTPGTGYTKATVVIIPGVAGAVGVAAMAPVGGHGRDMTKELPVEYILVNKRINAFESAFIPEGDLRQFTLVTGVGGSGNVLVGPASAVATPKADLTSARVLVIDNIDTVVHDADQYEEISLALRLVK